MSTGPGAINKAGKVGNYAGCLTRELHAPVKVHLARGRTGIDRASAANIVIAVPCASGHEVEIGLNQMFPPEIVRKKMTKAGWDFHHGPLCPPCVTRDKVSKRKSKPNLTLVPTPPLDQDLEPIIQVPEKEMPMETSATAIAAATSQQTLTPSAKAKAARREVMQWLEESFELTGPEKGRYKAGVTDATIAKETGCSTEAVAKIREEFFGALDKPKELDAISAEIGSLRLAAAELEHKATEAADTIKSHAAAEAKVIRDKATAIGERLARISKEQGWS